MRLLCDVCHEPIKKTGPESYRVHVDEVPVSVVRAWHTRCEPFVVRVVVEPRA